ncbi:cyclin-A1 [Bombina bombina]|uniref:cyclin-A1 n=1 Tax=Bombina bombina TaxID=8345 RepID=UPI00235AA6F4|nr:cyclin-A1 [Bombina bombina]
MHHSGVTNNYFAKSTMGLCKDYHQNPFSTTKGDAFIQSNLLPQRPPQRTVLGVISDNEQIRKPYGQGAVPKFLNGIENALPANVATKQCFAIYIDEPQKLQERCALEIEYPCLEEAEENLAKQNFHLLLEISAASPMLVDASLQSAEDQSGSDPDSIALSEYIEDIHLYLRQAEVKHRPKPYYMRKQPDVTPAMRTILIDWLVEVGIEYKLRTETLFLAVNYLDRFLSCMSVLRGKLQLVGTAAILLASKYEEVFPPEVDDLVYITDDTYTKKQLLRMEHLLLKVLAFDLTVPTVNQFLLQYFHRQAVCTKTEYFAMYLAELTLLDVDPFLQYLPSITAAAAYCLANYTINKVFWPESLSAFTGYSLSGIVPCLSDLHRACANAPHQAQQAIRDKYKASKYMQVSLLEPPASLPLK